jgi:hypothetical protein
MAAVSVVFPTPPSKEVMMAITDFGVWGVDKP